MGVILIDFGCRIWLMEVVRNLNLINVIINDISILLIYLKCLWL